MQLQFGSAVAVHNGRSLSCTGLYEVTAKIVPQVFVDLDGTLHMTHVRDSNIVSFPRLIPTYMLCTKGSSADWPYYSDAPRQKDRRGFSFTANRDASFCLCTCTATELLNNNNNVYEVTSSVHEWPSEEVE